jgi:CxxC motif-containing protein (DUF1111 family)
MHQRAVPLAVLLLVLSPLQMFAQVDPGIRPGPAGAGPALPSVLADNPATILSFFNDGQTRFAEIDSVSGTIVGEPGFGLGPRFNSRGCGECHAQPALGGTSPGPNSRNPQVKDGKADSANNVVPTFIVNGGPVREARFLFFLTGGVPDPSRPDGGVHDLFTIADRTDAGGCTSAVISQPDFATALAQNNIIFRIPTPLFGTGLMENVEETTLLTNLIAQSTNTLGISGTFNRNGNDGTISRFGWKAQNKSLEIFSGEAYNVEMGVSNQLFTQERPSPDEELATGLPAPCKINPTAEDHTNFNLPPIDTLSDVTQFGTFMRLLAPPIPSTTLPGGSASITRGHKLFREIGCEVCHNQMFTTEPSSVTPDLGSATLDPFSDLEIHHMGTTLADNVSQGNAGGDQFRTAPLWGAGQRAFFLHDGRTTDLLVAIAAHNSSGSEATQTVLNFNALASGDQQHILNFLRSL